MNKDNLFELLERKSAQFNQANFIEDDPISIPHQFTKKQDIEIAGFFAAMLSWGQRKTIISKCNELLERMSHSPYDFVVNHSDQDLKQLLGFKHRTFNDTDLLHFVAFFHDYYKKHSSLEEIFANSIHSDDENIEQGIIALHEAFFALPDSPSRTKKHVATPLRKSACKRINMYLRWMVRNDEKGVDFGLWDSIATSQLICPLDVHVENVAREFTLLHRKQSDWIAATELTNNLKEFDPIDPVKYDFALFGIGIERKDQLRM